MIFLQREHAIARREVEAIAVELLAVLQPVRERLLCHPGVKNLALEIVDGLLLGFVWSAHGGRRDQAQRESADAGGEIEMRNEASGGRHGSTIATG